MRLPILLNFIALSFSAMAFEVIEISPSHNVISVEPNAPILITFDDSIDIASVVGLGDVTVFGRWSGPADIDITVDGFGNTLVINMFEPFFAGEYVMVNLSSTVGSLGGETLGQGYTYGFWIRSLPGSMDLTDIEHLEVRQCGETFIQCYGAYAGDLDNDGWGDLTVVNEDSEDLRVFMSNEGQFSSFSVQELPLGNKPSSNEGADFNGDGEIDLVIGNTQGNMMSVVLGEGNGLFGPEVIYEADQGVRGVAILDIEGDGDMDIATANRNGSNISIFYNDGTGAFSDATTIESPLSAETAIIAADMNEDGIMDLVVGGYVSDDIGVFINNGSGEFMLVTQVASGDAPWMITMGDVNNDGHVDIAAASSGANRMSVHFGDGEGGLTDADSYVTGAFPLAIDLGDLDGDGDLDMISSNYSGGDYSLYENLGDGSFGNLRTLDAEIAGSCAIFHDRNNDGVMDLTGIDELADVLIFFESQSNGIDEREEEKALIYPNPSEDYFIIELGIAAEAMELVLLNAQGQVVDSRTVSTGETRIYWPAPVAPGAHVLLDRKNQQEIATLIKR